jgi:photosystem II stability/assembly factor-like uncharacterized protein
MKLHLFLSVVILIVSSLIFTACQDETRDPHYDFEHSQIGLDGLKVYNLEVNNNILYASTNDGVYKKQLNTNNAFTQIGLDGRNVVDFIVLGSQHVIATTANRGAIADDFGLHETTDGGASWEELPVFGTDEFEEPAISLSIHPDEPGVILASGYQLVASSSNYGRSWQLERGDWGAFATGTSVAEINPFKPDDLWYGGQGAIENGYLGVMRNGTQLNEWTDLVPNPTVAVEIAFDEQDDQNIYVGFEGSLMKTSNNGNTWHELINGRTNGMRFFYGIGLSENNPDDVFAGGWLKGEDTQPFILYYSTNAGNTWRNKTFENEQTGGIFSMKILSETSRERIFVGLDKGGVYEIIATRK